MIKTVIFDMYETLITQFESPLYYGTQMAEDLGLEPAVFLPTWRKTERARGTGEMTTEQAIEQANLGTFDTFVAKKYLIEQVPQIDIAEELGYDRTVVSRRVKLILPRVEYAAKRLFGNTHTITS